MDGSAPRFPFGRAPLRRIAERFAQVTAGHRPFVMLPIWLTLITFAWLLLC